MVSQTILAGGFQEFIVLYRQWKKDRVVVPVLIVSWKEKLWK